MKTIILAAGVGQRLGEISGNKPKCLLEFAGISLLERHFRVFDYYDLTDTIIVTGYQADMVDKSIKSYGCSGKVHSIRNEDYTRGSVISMLLGLEHLQKNDEFLLMDADVLYDHHMIQRLLTSSHKNCFLLDRDFVPGDEPVKLCVRNNQLVDFRKKIDIDLQYDYQGESVGFFRFDYKTAEQLISSAESYLAIGQNDLPYEECIRDLLKNEPGHFGYEDVTDLKWIEIDFPEDVERAEKEILPHIAKL